MIQPALTAEEWKEEGISVASRSGAMIYGDGADWLGFDDTERLSWKERRHAVAALALYNQDFGFTREELNHLKYIAEQTDWNGLLPIIQKIEALLPPER